MDFWERMNHVLDWTSKSKFYLSMNDEKSERLVSLMHDEVDVLIDLEHKQSYDCILTCFIGPGYIHHVLDLTFRRVLHSQRFWQFHVFPGSASRGSGVCCCSIRSRCTASLAVQAEALYGRCLCSRLWRQWLTYIRLSRGNLLHFWHNSTVVANIWAIQSTNFRQTLFSADSWTDMLCYSW